MISSSAPTSPAPAATKPRPGRPSKLDADTREVLLAAIRKGMTNPMAARIAGIAKSTFYNWMTRGTEAEQRVANRQPRKKGDGEYLELMDHLEGARAERTSIRLNRIEDAAIKGSWQADAWVLERCEPAIYGRQRHEVTGAEGGPIKTEGRIKIIKYNRVERTD